MDYNTGSGGGSGDGGSSGGPGVPPPPRVSGGATAEEFNLDNPVQSFLSTVRGVLLRPASFFRGMARSGDFLNPIVFTVICYLVYLVLAEIVALALGGILSAAFDNLQQFGFQASVSLVRFFIGLIAWPIWSVLMLLLLTVLRHLLVLLLVGSSNGGFEATLRIQSYVAATRLVWWVPIIGGIVGFFYSLYLYVVGIREVHSTSTGRAAVIVLAPWAVVFSFILLIVLFFGAAILTVLLGALSQQGS